jgi:prepilin-type N-terminal cleavage/methylation domain-containing protein
MRHPVRHQSGFGLLEVLVVMGVGALIIVLSYPGYKRSGLMEKAQTLKLELGQIEVALVQATRELQAPPGVWLTFDQYSKFLPPGSRLQRTGLDPFGQAYGPQRVGSKPAVPAKASEALHGMLPDGFWGTFPSGGDL